MQGLSSLQNGLLLSGIELVGDASAKQGSLLPAFASYNLLAYQLVVSLKQNPLGLQNSYWDGISNIATLALGYAMGETMTTQQYIGAFLITSGIFLLQNGKQTL